MIFSIAMFAIALIFIFGACMYPFVQRKLLQGKMLRELLGSALLCGYKCRKNYKNIFFVRNRSSSYDLLIYNEKRLYAVKLWTAAFSSSSLVLTDGGRVHERRIAIPVFDITRKDGKERYINGFKHTVPKTRLAPKFRRGREVEEILLIYPSYRSILFEGERRRVLLEVGDELFDKLVYSPSLLVKRLKETSVTQSGTEQKKEEVGTVSENN